MSLKTAQALWGAEAVKVALEEENPEAVSIALAKAIEAKADPPGALRSWALSQPWPRFCAIVRIVAGESRKDLARGIGDG